MSTVVDLSPAMGELRYLYQMTPPRPFFLLDSFSANYKEIPNNGCNICKLYSLLTTSGVQSTPITEPPPFLLAWNETFYGPSVGRTRRNPNSMTLW